MIAMARDSDYPSLLGKLEGRRTLIWACNTCARFCGVGGIANAEDLAGRLSSDGITVTGIVSSSACCFMKKAIAMNDESDGTHDVVLALCCDMGSRNAKEATGKEVLNPIVTFGPGYLDSDGVPHIASVICGETIMDETLEEVAERSGCFLGPYRGSPMRAIIARYYREPIRLIYKAVIVGSFERTCHVYD